MRLLLPTRVTAVHAPNHRFPSSVRKPYDATPLIDKLRASGARAAFRLSYLNDSLFIFRTCDSSVSPFR
jgi:hypothetical protein